MPQEVLFIIIGVAFIILTRIIWRLLHTWLAIGKLKEYAEKPFACPNCGERFHTKWYKLLWFRAYTIELSGIAKLKCPKCGETDLCRWVSEAK